MHKIEITYPGRLTCQKKMSTTPSAPSQDVFYGLPNKDFEGQVEPKTEGAERPGWLRAMHWVGAIFWTLFGTGFLFVDGDFLVRSACVLVCISMVIFNRLSLGNIMPYWGFCADFGLFLAFFFGSIIGAAILAVAIMLLFTLFK